MADLSRSQFPHPGIVLSSSRVPLDYHSFVRINVCGSCCGLLLQLFELRRLLPHQACLVAMLADTPCLVQRYKRQYTWAV